MPGQAAADRLAGPGTGGFRGPLDALDRQLDAGQFAEQAGRLGERHGSRRPRGHLGQAGRHRGAGDAELGVPGSQAVPAGAAVVPGTAHHHRTERGIDGFLPVGHECSLMTGPAVHPGTAVAGVGGQQVFQQAGTQPGHRGPDSQLHRLQAADGPQRARRHGGQALYLGRGLRLERLAEPPLSPAGPAGDRSAERYLRALDAFGEVAAGRECRYCSTSSRLTLPGLAERCQPVPGRGRVKSAEEIMNILPDGVVAGRRRAGGLLPLHAVHRCDQQEFGSIDPIQVIERLAHELKLSVPGYARRPGLAEPRMTFSQTVHHAEPGSSITLIEKLSLGERNPRRAWDRIIRRPLEALEREGQLVGDIVIMIDGLDEAVEGFAVAPTLKQTVRARQEAGHSQRAIARDLNIGPRKVKRIIDQAA